MLRKRKETRQAGKENTELAYVMGIFRESVMDQSAVYMSQC